MQVAHREPRLFVEAAHAGVPEALASIFISIVAASDHDCVRRLARPERQKFDIKFGILCNTCSI